MKSGFTVDDVLREKKITTTEQKELAHLIDATRKRAEMLRYELVSGRAAARGLSESLQSLGKALERLAHEVEESAGELAEGVKAEHAPLGGGPIREAVAISRARSDN